MRTISAPREPRGVYNNHVNARLSDVEYALLREMAFTLKTSMSSLIHISICAFLDYEGYDEYKRAVDRLARDKDGKPVMRVKSYGK